MKLYYYPGACSLAAHIVLREAGYSFDLDRVDLAKNRTVSGADYLTINPNGYVPVVLLDDGQILTETAVILQYLADQKQNDKLVPRAGTMERYRLMEWLNFISSELHKTLGALFNPKITPEWKDHQIDLFGRRCDYLAQKLGANPFLTGNTFTVADAYLFTILNWTGLLGVDMNKWPVLKDYLARIGTRTAVKAAQQAEGLIK